MKVSAMKRLTERKTKPLNNMKSQAKKLPMATKSMKVSKVTKTTRKAQVHMKRPSGKVKETRKTPKVKKDHEEEARLDRLDSIMTGNLKSLRKALTPTNLNAIQTRPDWLLAISYQGNSTRLQILLDAGLDANSKGLLNGCVSVGHVSFLKLLLKHGADPLANCAPSDKDTAFWFDPFEACARPLVFGYNWPSPGKMRSVLLELKTSLFTRHGARAPELWRDAIDRMRDLYLEEGESRAGLGRFKKRLREVLLEFVEDK